MTPPPPHVQARVDQLVAAFRAAEPGMPPREVLSSMLKGVVDGGPPLQHVLTELWLTAVAAAGQVAALTRQLEQVRPDTNEPLRGDRT